VWPGWPFWAPLFLPLFLRRLLVLLRPSLEGGFSAVLAVGVDLAFQLLDPFRESGDLHGLLLKDLFKGGDQIGYSIYSFVVYGLDVLTLHKAHLPLEMPFNRKFATC
jgi:hypothetical protein